MQLRPPNASYTFALRLDSTRINMKFDLNLLPIVCTLYEERSVSRAAAKLGKSQPTISRSLKRMRETFGDPLFVKSGRGVQPTAKAVVLVASAREIMSRLQGDIFASSEFNPTAYDGKFTVATTEAAEYWLWPHAFSRLRQLSPYSTLELVRMPTSSIPVELENGSIDLALGFFAGLCGNNVMRQGILRIRPICMLRADHPFRGKKLSIKQFQSVEHIVVDAIGRNLTVDRILVQNKINRKVALIVSGYASLAPIISSSNLIVTLPRALGMRMAAATPGLKVMEPPVRIPPVIVAQYWHRKLQNEARNQWLRNTLKGIISQQHEAPERLK